MITYDKKLPIEVQVERPDFKSYLLLDREFQGTRIGLMSAMGYIRDSFMLNNDDFRFMYMQLGMKDLQHMEVLAKLIHQMHGSDDRYYDEDNDDTPTHELIQPLVENDPVKPLEQHHVNNDITAATMYHIEDEEYQIRLYQELDAKINDTGAHDVFSYILEGKHESVKILRGILNTLTRPDEVKDFGLGYDSENASSPNSGNYIDKPNPEFINPSELEVLKSKKT